MYYFFSNFGNPPINSDLEHTHTHLSDLTSTRKNTENYTEMLTNYVDKIVFNIMSCFLIVGSISSLLINSESSISIISISINIFL